MVPKKSTVSFSARIYFETRVSNETEIFTEMYIEIDKSPTRTVTDLNEMVVH